MKFTKLGRSGCEVSQLCLGTMNFGVRTAEADAFRIMDRALELGINFFDTANVYGRPVQAGLTEEIIGRWLAQGGGRRDQVVLATKFYNPMLEASVPNDRRGLSAYRMRRDLEDSLRRLRTDHIDLYQMHHVDRTAGWDELFGAFEVFINQGKIIYVGSSNFAGWDIAHAQGHARERGFIGLVCEQHKYSLLTRQPELEVLPACQHLGVGMIAWSPLEGGLLGGNVFDAPEGSRSSKLQERAEGLRWQLEAFSAFCRELGEKEADVALAWVLHHPAMTAPIIGPRTIEQLEGSLRALEIQLDDGMMTRLHEIFPGPGKGAPEAYAW